MRSVPYSATHTHTHNKLHHTTLKTALIPQNDQSFTRVCYYPLAYCPNTRANTYNIKFKKHPQVRKQHARCIHPPFLCHFTYTRVIKRQATLVSSDQLCKKVVRQPHHLLQKAQIPALSNHLKRRKHQKILAMHDFGLRKQAAPHQLVRNPLHLLEKHLAVKPHKRAEEVAVLHFHEKVGYKAKQIGQEVAYLFWGARELA